MNRQLNFTPKTTGKRRTKEKNKNKISRRREIIKNQAEIKQKEMKEKIVNINKTKSWFFEKINKIDKPLVILIKNYDENVCNRQCRNTKYYETIMNNDMAIKWKTVKKWTHS